MPRPTSQDTAFISNGSKRNINRLSPRLSIDIPPFVDQMLFIFLMNPSLFTGLVERTFPTMHSLIFSSPMVCSMVFISILGKGFVEIDISSYNLANLSGSMGTE